MTASTFRSGRARPILIGSVSIAILLLAWKAASMAVGRDLILPAPERVLSIALGLYRDSVFLEALWATFLRGLAAFGLSTAFGAAVGFLAGSHPTLGAAMAPVLTAIRATPVLALILLALLWFPSGFVPIFSAFLMAFPVMVANAAEGAAATDPRLEEMAALFKVPGWVVFARLRLPSAAPHLIAGARSALGLSWKVVVAGEVLSQPTRGLGTGMQEARVLLETGSVFAWAAAAVLLCGATEWAFGLLAKKASRRGL